MGSELDSLLDRLSNSGGIRIMLALAEHDTSNGKYGSVRKRAVASEFWSFAKVSSKS